MATDVRDGFICPLCMLELESAQSLQVHFDTDHNADAAIAKRKGFFGRKRDRKKDTDGSKGDGPVQRVAWAPQGFGVSRRMTLMYRERRGARLKKASEEQKLVLKLESLLFEGPSGSRGKAKRERKEYEKSVVLWTHNSLAKLCTTCGQKFSTVRRKHHCRLCGTVLCAKCSLGLDVAGGAELCRLAAANRGGKSLDQQEVCFSSQDMRVCRFCHGSLQAVHRKEIHDNKYKLFRSKGMPAVAKVAGAMQTSIQAIDDMMPYYLQISDSLSRFEELEEYGPATKLRSEILGKCQELANFGKQLKAVNDKLVDTEGPKSDARRVRGGMLKRLSEYVQANMVGLPKLPKEEEVKEALKRIEEQRARALDTAASQTPAPDSDTQSLGKISVRVSYEPNCLVVHILSCSDLIAVGPNLSDPYVLTTIMGMKKRSKTMKGLINPEFDEELRYDGVGTLEFVATEIATVEVWSETKIKGKGRSKHPYLGRINIPVGLAVDHGESFTTCLLEENDTTEWTPFTPAERFAMQIQLLDDVQQFSIMNTVASGMDFRQAMDLVQQFVGGETVTRGSKADAARAKIIIDGLHQLQRLDDIQRDAILSSVMKGGMPIDEAMSLVQDFVRKGLSAQQSQDSSRTRGGERAQYKQLHEMLAHLDKIQAQPIAESVQNGSMHVTEAIEFVKQFVNAESQTSANDDAEPSHKVSVALPEIGTRDHRNDDNARKLNELLLQLDPVQAQPIYDSVQSGQMSISEALSFVGNFIATTATNTVSSMPALQPVDEAAPAVGVNDTPNSESSNATATSVTVHLSVNDVEGLIVAVDSVCTLGEVSLPHIFLHVSSSEPETGQLKSAKSFDGRTAVFRCLLSFSEGLVASILSDSVVVEVWDLNPGSITFLGCAYINVGSTLNENGGTVDAVLKRPEGYLPAFDPSALSEEGLPPDGTIGDGSTVDDDSFSRDELLKHNQEASSTDQPLRQTFMTLINQIDEVRGKPIFDAVESGHVSLEDGVFALQSALDEPQSEVLDAVSHDTRNTHVEADLDRNIHGITPVVLTRNGDGFGLAIGYGSLGVGHGVYVTKIKTGSVASNSGRVIVGSQILAINGHDATQADKGDIVPYLRNCTTVELLLRPPHPAVTAAKVNPTEENYSQASNVSRRNHDEVTSESPVAITERSNFKTVTLSKIDGSFGMSMTSGSIGGNTGVGVYVSKVKAGGPAELSGCILPGCQIMAVNGHDVSGVDKPVVIAYLRDSEMVDITLAPPDSRMVSVLDSRSGKVIDADTISYASSSMSYASSDATVSRSADLSFKTTTLQKGDKGFGMSLSSSSESGGVYVSKVTPGGAADRSGCIASGCQILAIDGHDVSNAEKASILNYLHQHGAIQITVSSDSQNVPESYVTSQDSSFYTVNVTRNDQGHGISIATRDDGTVYVSAVTEGGAAAATGSIVVGCQIHAIDGHDVHGTDETSLMTYLQDTPTVTLTLCRSDGGSSDAVLSRITKSEETEPLEEVSLTKNDKGFGFTVSAVPERLGGGVYVSKVAPNGPAGKSGLVHAGSRVRRINGYDVSATDKSSVISFLKESSSVEIALSNPENELVSLCEIRTNRIVASNTSAPTSSVVDQEEISNSSQRAKVLKQQAKMEKKMVKQLKREEKKAQKQIKKTGKKGGVVPDEFQMPDSP